MSALKSKAQTDTLLIERFRKGDDSAFEEIISQYWDLVFSRVYSLLKNRQDAEEVTQDTFVRAMRGLDKFRGEASLSTWIYQIATNLARNRYWYWWRRKRDQSVSFDLEVGEDGGMTLHDVLPAGGESPNDAALTQEFVDQVATKLNSLTESHREVLLLRNRDGLAYEEISERLGISLGTVKSRIARARERLWELMGSDFHG